MVYGWTLFYRNGLKWCTKKNSDYLLAYLFN